MISLPKFESMTVEFKQEWNDKKDGAGIKKTLVAFANTAGGDLYIGVSDDGQVLGLDDPNLIEEKIATTVRDSISPSLVGNISVDRLNDEAGKTILRVHVDAGRYKPYCLDPKNASGIFIRLANTSVPASIDDISRMVRECNPIPYEDRISFEQDLTFDRCMRFCQDHGLDFNPRSNHAYGFFNAGQKMYTNLAYICSDQANCSTVMVNFADDEKIRMISSARSEGSIFKMYQEVTDFIAASNQAGIEKPRTGNVERIDHYFVDPRVILEALVNMVAHRDYSNPVANIVHITPSKIEINTIGGLAEGLSLEDVVERMQTECRNKKLALLLSSLKLMENRGSGLRLIREYYKEIPVENLLKVSRTSFTISLYRNRDESLAEDPLYKKLFVYLAGKQPQSRKEIQEYLQLSQTSAISLLNSMVEKRLIEPVGAGRSRKYKIKNS